MLLFCFISFFSLTFCPSACSYLVCMVPQCLFSLLLSVLATGAQPQKKTNPQLCWSPRGFISPFQWLSLSFMTLLNKTPLEPIVCILASALPVWSSSCLANTSGFSPLSYPTCAVSPCASFCQCSSSGFLSHFISSFLSFSDTPQCCPQPDWPSCLLLA